MGDVVRGNLRRGHSCRDLKEEERSQECELLRKKKFFFQVDEIASVKALWWEGAWTFKNVVEEQRLRQSRDMV